ncbi:MAG: NAD(P)-binding domain-containing protein [Rhodobacter sp.]|jgi:3-hydroxyisobutyrate dehydrogenase-like beta-hydroxyacid dehydrogenase|nr:NAD(P)-binding domain-containing protein [Rhodobacter sp.]
MTEVSVIGLGAMGTALAMALVGADRELTVWNRTPEKMRPLVAAGARQATSFDDAVAASPKVIVCLPGYSATSELFLDKDTQALLAGRTVVQLSTASPKEAVDAEKWFAERNASFLAGAILCWPGNIGTESGKIVVAGHQKAFEDCGSELRALAGGLRYLGPNIRAPSTVDLAFLSRTLGIIFGSIHGALVCEAEGVPVSEFTAILPPGDRAVPLTETINNGTFDTISEAGASVDVAWAAVRQLKQQAQDSGINSELPDLMAAWVNRAQAAGFGAQETAAVIKTLRTKI